MLRFPSSGERCSYPSAIHALSAVLALACVGLVVALE
jgi:hypothetical protein